MNLEQGFTGNRPHGIGPFRPVKTEAGALSSRHQERGNFPITHMLLPPAAGFITACPRFFCMRERHIFSGCI